MSAHRRTQTECASGNSSTPGHGPTLPSGWTSTASHVPSGVRTSTSRSVRHGGGARIDAGHGRGARGERKHREFATRHRDIRRLVRRPAIFHVRSPSRVISIHLRGRPTGRSMGTTAIRLDRAEAARVERERRAAACRVSTTTSPTTPGDRRWDVAACTRQSNRQSCVRDHRRMRGCRANAGRCRTSHDPLRAKCIARSRWSCESYTCTANGASVVIYFEVRARLREAPEQERRVERNGRERVRRDPDRLAVEAARP